MNKSSYPPSHHLHSSPIAPNAALTHLESYLQSSTTSPHLHPDALLHPGGISYSSTGGGPQGGIILHQLRRIAAGLRGEILAPDPETLDDWKSKGDDVRLDGEKERVRKRMAGDSDGPGKSALKRRRVEMGEAVVDSEGEVLRNGEVDGEESEWVDGEENARRQEVVEGEVGERGGAPVEEYEGEPGVARHQNTGAGPKSDREKEARKADKKARKKAEQREKEARRAAG